MKTSKPDILEAAVKLASSTGLYLFTRAEVATESGMAESTVSFHFGTMDELRHEVVKRAVNTENLPILADARSGRAPINVPMNAKLRKKVAAFIAR